MVAGVLRRKLPPVRPDAVDGQAVKAVGGDVQPGRTEAGSEGKRDPEVLGRAKFGVVPPGTGKGVGGDIFGREVPVFEAGRGGLLLRLDPDGVKRDAEAAGLKPAFGAGGIPVVVPDGEADVVAGHRFGGPAGNFVFDAGVRLDSAGISGRFPVPEELQAVGGLAGIGFSRFQLPAETGVWNVQAEGRQLVFGSQVFYSKGLQHRKTSSYTAGVGFNRLILSGFSIAS